MKTKILVVEDEAAIREMICFVMKQSGFDVRKAADADEARQSLVEQTPDLIVMDWMLPGVSGVEFTRELKRSSVFAEIPVMMLTARGEEDDKVRGLECGVDDYVTKPFSPRELVARINVVLRRVAPHVMDETTQAGGVRLDPASHEVTIDEQTVKLGPTEFRLLHFFMTHKDKVYSRPRLLDHVWGANVYVEERTVDVHIRRLRKALEPTGKDTLIQTVRGVGYRFSERVGV